MHVILQTLQHASSSHQELQRGAKIDESLIKRIGSLGERVVGAGFAQIECARQRASARFCCKFALQPCACTHCRRSHKTHRGVLALYYGTTPV